MKTVAGLHHVTVIAGPAQENLDFYAGILGMSLVKKSVNQDDPGTYHLFYADAEGRRLRLDRATASRARSPWRYRAAASAGGDRAWSATAPRSAESRRGSARGRSASAIRTDSTSRSW